MPPADRDIKKTADQSLRFTPAQSNWMLIRWMIGLGLRYPFRCLSLIGLNTTMLLITLSGLTFAGLAVDVLRRAAEGETAPEPVGPFGTTLPDSWTPLFAIIVIAVGIVLLALGLLWLRYVTAITHATLVQRMMVRLRRQIYDKLQRMSFRFFDANETGSIINRATGDVAWVSAFAETALIETVALLITLVVSFLYMYSIHLKLTLAALATTPILAVSVIVFSKKVRPGYVENRRLYDELVLSISENAQGQHVVKGFSIENEEIDKFRQHNEKYAQQQRWLFKRVATFNAVASSLTQMSLIIVLAYGGYLVIHYSQLGDPRPPITVGKLIVFTRLLSQFSSQVVTLASMADTMQMSLTSAGRIYDVLRAHLEIKSPTEAVSLTRAKGEVEFQNVDFAYNESDPVLRDVSFRVEPGQCVAILGATGAGKSTLLSLIPRFYDPTRGRVLVDGVEVQRYNVGDLRRSIGLVFQENFLFSNTIRANIAFGNPDATEDQILTAAKTAAAHEFIEELSDGYDTVVGEQGAGLSGGQKQRLAIARALLLDPRILILDDATAAIDPETEHEILQAMDNAREGRTTLVVAHRLSTLRRADFAIVFDRGRIIETGTHDQLMKSMGRYHSAAQLQVADEESESIILARQWYDGEVDSLLLDRSKRP